MLPKLSFGETLSIHVSTQLAASVRSLADLDARESRCVEQALPEARLAAQMEVGLNPGFDIVSSLLIRFLRAVKYHFAPVNRRDCSRGLVSGENACATVAARWLDKFSARRSVGLGGETRLLGKDAVRKSTPANWIGEDFRDFTRAGCFRRSMDVALSIRSPDRTVSADGGLQLRHPVRTSGSY